MPPAKQEDHLLSEQISRYPVKFIPLLCIHHLKSSKVLYEIFYFKIFNEIYIKLLANLYISTAQIIFFQRIIYIAAVIKFKTFSDTNYGIFSLFIVFLHDNKISSLSLSYRTDTPNG